MLPNLLATRRGRLAAFFLLYITEGIPLGFAATAIAFHLRKLGVGPAEIGAFVGSFYLPWAFKWAFGPLVDVFRSKRFGHRRAWIMGAQLVMAATLAVLVLVKLPDQLWLFTAILLVHNTFAAIQDVAIDGLACNSLTEDERGLGNGLMFAGAALGQALGGGGVLLLSAYTGFSFTFFFVAMAILAVTCLVVLPMKEAVVQTAVQTVVQATLAQTSAMRRVGGEMRAFAVEAFRAFLATRGAFAGVAFNLLPAGAMTLGLATRSSLTAELGFSESQAGQLELWSNVIAAGGMILGGWLSDRLGRRLTLFTYIALMSLPVAWLGWKLQQLGYVMPRDPGSGAVAGAPALAAALWVASLVFQFFMGLMYGTRSAIMMDVTNPKVAGTQFTAYMAMANLAIAYSATWHGLSAEALGYPKTLFIDACVGLLSLLILPLITPSKAAEKPQAASGRARWLAGFLGLACLAWLPFAQWGSAMGKMAGVMETFFTLFFIGSSVLMLAAAALLPRSPLTRALPWMALALVLMYARRFVDPSLAEQLITSGVALSAAGLLWVLARHPWKELETAPD